MNITRFFLLIIGVTITLVGCTNREMGAVGGAVGNQVGQSVDNQ